MAADDFARAVAAATDKLLRDRWKLPDDRATTRTSGVGGRRRSGRRRRRLTAGSLKPDTRVMLTPGTVIELTIEKPAAGGRMVARHEGLVVLVHAAIPGERVRAVVERTGQGVAYATTMDVVEPSPDRRTGIRDWACGGSVYAHIAYPRQTGAQGRGDRRRAGANREGRRSTQPVPVTGSPEDGYRMRARFHVRGRTLGYFREGTHGMCDPMTTRQLLPETGRTARRTRRAGAGGPARGRHRDRVERERAGHRAGAPPRARIVRTCRPGSAEVAALPDRRRRQRLVRRPRPRRTGAQSGER